MAPQRSLIHANTDILMYCLLGYFHRPAIISMKFILVMSIYFPYETHVQNRRVLIW